MPSLKPLNCKSHLMDMLASNTVSKWDKTAIRFALHVMDNSVYQPKAIGQQIAQQFGPYTSHVMGSSEYRPKAITHKDFPFWRIVRYTDDGCALYQCLNCKGEWEGREAPGWLNWLKEVDKVDSTCQYGEKFFIHLEIPEDMRNWKYCPHCCIEWDGPIRRDKYNERMLGKRRKRIEDAIYERRTKTGKRGTCPAFFWVLEYCEPQTRWIKEKKFNPVPARLIKSTLSRIRKDYRDKPRYDDGPSHNRRYRITKMKNTEANRLKLSTLSDGYT